MQSSKTIEVNSQFTMPQWRSEAKFRPVPTVEVLLFPPIKFAYKSLKGKKIMFRAKWRYKEY